VLANWRIIRDPKTLLCAVVQRIEGRWGHVVIRSKYWRANEAALQRLTSGDVRRILDIHDEMPIEPFSYDAGDARVRQELLTYAEPSRIADEKLEYFLACRVT